MNTNPVVRVKRSLVQGKVPEVIQLGLGELAINHYDGKLFIRQDTLGVGVGTTVIEIGGGSNNWIKKTTTYTASVSDWIIADTSSGSWTLTLPASPSTGDTVTIADGGNWATNNLTVGRNGSTIEGGTEDFILDVGQLIITFLYDGTTWEIFSSVGAQGEKGDPGDSYWVETLVGIHTLSNVGIGTTNPRYTLEVGTVGAAGTSLWVNGDARVTGILSVGQGTITLDGGNNQVNVGTGVTIHHTNGIQVGSNILHSSGLTINTLNTSGVSTFTELKVGTGGTIITATSGGLVGVGQTNPQYKLDVGGDINFTGTFYQNSSPFVASRWTAGTGNDIYRLLGNVGIGTTNPTVPLHLRVSSNTGMYIDAASGYPVLWFAQNGTSKWALVSNFNADNAFTIRESGVADRLTILTGGNVGIGVTNPGEKLDVRGNLNVGGVDAGPNYIAFRGTTGDNPGSYNHTYIGERIWSGSESSELFIFKGNDVNAAPGPDRIRLAAAELWFDTYTTATGGASFESVATSANITTKMTLTGAGNLGIGITNPTTKLDVIGNSRIGGAASRSSSGLTVGFTNNNTFSVNADVGDSYRMLSLINESATTNAMSILGFRINPDGGSANAMLDMKFVQTGATNTSAIHYSFNHAGSFADRFSILSSGNVGIGITAPTQKLDVRGNTIIGAQVSGATATPPYLSLGANYTNTALRANCKIRLYDNGADVYGFNIGSAGDVQYHSTTTHQFYNSDVGTLTVNASGTSTPKEYRSTQTNSDQAYAGQHNVNAPFYNTFSQTGSQYQAIVKGRSVGAASTVVASFGVLHNTDNTHEIVFHRIKSDGTDVRYYNLTGNSGTIWHAGNDGAGSGLDADLLDGLSSGSFLRSDADSTGTGSYLFNRNNPAIGNGSYAQTNNHIELRTGNASNPILGFHRAGYTATALYHAGYGIDSLRIRNADGNDGPIFSTFNDGAGSGLDADLLDGYNSSTSASANTIMLRDGSGHASVVYLFSTYLNMSHSEAARTSDTVFYSSYDSYIRKNDAAGMRASLNVPTRTGGDASGTWSINVTGSSTNCTFSNDSTDRANITTRVDSGFYQYSNANTTEGWPITTNSWMHLLACTHNNDGNYYSMQIAANFFNNTDLYYRSTNGNGSTGWVKIWNSGNDGAGSGLDADLLDGLSSGSFAQISANNTFSQRQFVYTPSASASNDVWAGAIEIREVGLVANSQTGSAYAPGINFHWGNVCASAIKMYSDQSIRFIANGSTGSSYTSIFASTVVTNAGTLGSNGNGTRTVQAGGSATGGSDGDIYYIY